MRDAGSKRSISAMGQLLLDTTASSMAESHRSQDTCGSVTTAKGCWLGLKHVQSGCELPGAIYLILNFTPGVVLYIDKRI